VQPSAPLLCPACGTPISVFGGRCPSCGSELRGAAASPPALRPARGAPRQLLPERSAGRPGLLALACALIVLGVLAAGTWHLRRTSAELSSAAVGSSLPPPPEPAVVTADPLELGRALVAARGRAQSWHPDPHLVSVVIERVDKGKLDEDGSIQFEFGKSKAGQLGPRAPVGPERLLVVRTRAGQQERTRNGPAARSVAEPNCPLEEAWRKTVASGIRSNATLAMRYELSKKHDRAVWIVSVTDTPGLTRTLDGDNCAILAR
jgi:hypothetical protein